MYDDWDCQKFLKFLYETNSYRFTKPDLIKIVYILQAKGYLFNFDDWDIGHSFTDSGYYSGVSSWNLRYYLNEIYNYVNTSWVPLDRVLYIKSLKEFSNEVLNILDTCETLSYEQLDIITVYDWLLKYGLNAEDAKKCLKLKRSRYSEELIEEILNLYSE